MYRSFVSTTALLAAVCGLSVLASGCSGDQAPPDAELAGKIPVTSSSLRARKLFLEGRELADKIRFTDARDYFLKAVDEDPQFALAYLYLANNSISAKEFFSSLKKAVFLAPEVSEGERHWILGRDAGSRGKPEAQLEHYLALVELYPEEERAHALVANYHFRRQDYERAIEYFERATAIDPAFSPAYNLLGYALRSLGDYDRAEAAFKKYIELIPDEPNPYDSYAELLMKVGRFEESIENYRKALEKSPQFAPSYVGIGNNQMFGGDYDGARATFAELLEQARNTGERRTSHFWTAVSHVFEGDAGAALEAAARMAAIAEQDDDKVALARDHGFMGNVHLHMGSPEDALAEFERAVELLEEADVNDDVKHGARRNLTYQEGRVAVHQGKLAKAAGKSREFQAAAEARGIADEIRRAHQLAGMVALARGDAGAALAELEQANAQNPIVLYFTAKAARRAGDVERARAMADSAAHFNQLTPNFAFIKARADALVAELEGGS